MIEGPIQLSYAQKITIMSDIEVAIYNLLQGINFLKGTVKAVNTRTQILSLDKKTNDKEKQQDHSNISE